MKTYHINQTDQGWEGRTEKGERASFVSQTKEDALQRIIEIAKNHSEPVSVRVHKMDGEIQEERTYPGSADPKISEG
ncbi:MAG: DUF2188 domain-containing protein [Flavobacterium sp.]|nr:DUF2188 domain-containing protein [Flavobacterium sp.]